MASALPTPDTLAKAAALTVFDAEGERVSFASIIRDQKTIVVFIRRLYPAILALTGSLTRFRTPYTGHFFCGVCASAPSIVCAP